MAKNSEQIKELVNQVRINGTLAEIKTFEGNTKEKNTPYISVDGQIRYGNTAVETARFRMFCLAEKADGTESKAYKTLCDWVDKAVPMTDSVENATKLCLTANVVDNDFYNAQDELVEGIGFNGRFINPYEEENETYVSQASMTVDGYVQSITDEIRNEEPTGRKRFTLVTTDYTRRAIIIKNIIVPQDLVDAFDDVIEKGTCAQFFLGYYLHKGEKRVVNTGGIGRQRTTTGRDYTELIFEGCSVPYEEDSPYFIDSKILKELMNNRQAHLDELKERHEASESNGSKTTANRRGVATKSKSKPAEMDDIVSDDDIPF